MTRIGHFADPTVWGWMWGAPERANYQVVVWVAAGCDLSAAERAVSEALECVAVRYPCSPDAEPGAAADGGA